MRLFFYFGRVFTIVLHRKESDMYHISFVGNESPVIMYVTPVTFNILYGNHAFSGDSLNKPCDQRCIRHVKIPSDIRHMNNCRIN
jgi:hypothetical protein